jgi:ADP-heptose:LPS heptosyltransferase
VTWLLDNRPLERALVTRLRYLGDVVMATVVVDALRRGDPGLEIGFLCEEAYAPVLAGLPGLARVHALSVRRRGADARARTGESEGGLPARPAAATIARLRAARYDLAVDLFFNPRSAWLLRLAGIRHRVAGPAGSRGWLYTHQVDAAPERGREAWDRLAPGGPGDHLARLAPLVHAESGQGFVDWFLAGGVRACPRLSARPGAAASAAATLARAGLEPDSPFLVLAPGATWESKRWPIGHWAALARELPGAWPGSIAVLTPPGADIPPLSASMTEDARVAVLPPLPLPTVLDVLATASGTVSVDGGVMHASVGLGTPTLALFGPTDPGLWFPYEGAGPFRVLARRPACHPCDRHLCDAFICLPELEPATVMQATMRMLADAGEPRGGGGR